MNIQMILAEKFNQAFIDVGISKDFTSQVCQSTRVQFGDYQVNGIMAAAKNIGIPSYQLAEKILSKINLSGIANKIEIMSPGFINIFLDPIFLAKEIDRALRSEILGVTKPVIQTIVVDYSAPNVAKEMHVGHLRSTVIGDAIVRILNFLGHKVIRANHIGDWGTQFGMLIAYLEMKQQTNMENIVLSDLEKFYTEAKQYFNESESFAKLARDYVVKLQYGDKYLLKVWRKLVDITMSHNQIIYDRLNITLTQNDVMGESFYNTMLADIITDLKAKGLAVESHGAIVVFLDIFKNRQGEPMGVVIQKKDSGYLYTTTDIACIKYRCEILHSNRIIYYTDSRQHQHLMQVWTIARKAGYVPDDVQLEHHMFGMILGKNGKPFKTRSGDTIKLTDLLDEALKRARRLVINKNPHISSNTLEKLAHAVGIGAVKYSDLSRNRTTDYIFNWDDILAFDGNTAPYMQYAYVRMLSILRKADIDKNILSDSIIVIYDNYEIQLATRLLQFEESLTIAARNGTPHIMCSYLYNLTSIFSEFYEHCSILNINDIVIRNSRLKLVQLTAKTLKFGLDMLGIETIEYM